MPGIQSLTHSLYRLHISCCCCCRFFVQATRGGIPREPPGTPAEVTSQPRTFSPATATAAGPGPGGFGYRGPYGYQPALSGNAAGGSFGSGGGVGYGGYGGGAAGGYGPGGSGPSHPQMRYHVPPATTAAAAAGGGGGGEAGKDQKGKGRGCSWRVTGNRSVLGTTLWCCSEGGNCEKGNALMMCV